MARPSHELTPSILAALLASFERHASRADAAADAGVNERTLYRWIDRGAAALIRDAAELADGARIVVVWSGGNGPHEYTFRAADRGAWGEGPRGFGPFYVGGLGMIGEAPLTQVWRAEDRPFAELAEAAEIDRFTLRRIRRDASRGRRGRRDRAGP